MPRPAKPPVDPKDVLKIEKRIITDLRSYLKGGLEDNKPVLKQVLSQIKLFVDARQPAGD